MSARSRSPVIAAHLLLQPSDTDFEDIRTTPRVERRSETPGRGAKGWAGAAIRPVSCPLHRAHECLLRVSPSRRNVSAAEGQRLSDRHREELEALQVLGVPPPLTPRLEQGQLLPETHQLAMVIEKFGDHLGHFLRRPWPPEIHAALAALLMELIVGTASRGIFHGDIKPENIVVDAPREGHGLRARLIDFDPKYTSVVGKDGDLLAEFQGNGDQLSALYAVSMAELLYQHLRKRGFHPLAEAIAKAMRGFALFLPADLDMEESKFGRVLVRHVRHYKLLTKHPPQTRRGDRSRLLLFFWAALRRRNITVQPNPTDVPSFQGVPFRLRSYRPKPPPPLAPDLLELARRLTQERQAR